MTNRRRNLLVLLLVAGLLIGSAVVIAKQPSRLGLDLRGGVQLVYEGRGTPQQPEVTPEAVDRALEIIRERTDKLGVAEPEIQRLGANQIQVGLPDVRNVQRAIEQVGDTAQLYLYDWERNVLGNSERPVTNEFEAVQRASRQESRCEECTIGERFYLVNPETRIVRAGPEQERQDLFLDFRGGRAPEGLEVVTVPRGTLILDDETRQSGREDTESRRPDARPDGPFWVIRDRPELSGTDMKNPEQQFDPTTNQPNVTFEFTGEGREKFQRVTRRLAQRGLAESIPGQPPDFQSFAIVLDTRLVSNPIIDFNENPDGIDGRTGAQISGGFAIQEAQDLANFLRIGALPINLKLVSQTTVSATLGEQALDQGLKAGIAGLVGVLLFLMLFYRLLGVIAGIALVAYGVLFYALVELIPITLTLPGIAGLVLTIGVAADSNVVIFERIKEEVRAGRSMPTAIAAGYTHGIRTIIDANVVTLLTAFILFVLATAGVKGFAFTLGIGTIVSLFTAVIFTQAVLGTFSRSPFLRRPSLLGADPEAPQRFRINFVGLSKLFFSASGVILLIGAVALSTKQLNLGIDFESGTRIKAGLERTASEDEVREAIGPLGLDEAEIQEVEEPEFGRTVYQINTSQLEPEDVGRVQRALNEEFGLTGAADGGQQGESGFESQSIGPAFGETIARSAVIAILLSLILISAYVAFRFEAKFAIPVIIAVVHDLVITAGIYSVAGAEMTSGTVAALLTILGYSLYDTVIVFDRIRENLPRLPRATFSQVVNKSMSEIIVRSLVTSNATLMPLTALLLFGGETLQTFAFALIIGLVSGTYSSIFIAGPVLTAWKEKEPAFRRRRERLIETMGHVPAFPEDNRVAMLDGEEPDEPGGGAESVDEPITPQPEIPPSGEAEAAEPQPVTPPSGEASLRDDNLREGSPAVTAEAAPDEKSPQPPASQPKKRKQQSKRRRKHGRAR